MKWFKPKSSVGVFRRQSKILVEPRHRTTAGVYIGGEPVLTATHDVSPEELGEMVLRCLREGKNGVPHPTDWSTLPHPLLKAAGVRSWSAFVKGTILCDVHQTGSVVKIAPMRHLGGRQGFVPFAEENGQSLSVTAPAALLGEAVLNAIEFAAAHS